MKKIGTKQLVPILTAIMGVVFAVLGFTQLGFWDKTDGPMPGFFPSIMAIVMVLSSILALIQSFKEDEKAVYHKNELLVIAGGAFTDLYNQKAEEKKNTVGFGSEVSSINKEIQYGTELTIKDFEKFGMPLEFMGRFKTIIRMNKLKLEDLVNILKTSNLSEMKSYVDLLESKGIKLDIPEQLYEKIAELAYSYGTGARGLNIVVDNIFDNILYELFEGIDKVESITLGEDIVKDKNNFTLKKVM